MTRILLSAYSPVADGAADDSVVVQTALDACSPGDTLVFDVDIIQFQRAYPPLGVHVKGEPPGNSLHTRCVRKANAGNWVNFLYYRYDAYSAVNVVAHDRMELSYMYFDGNRDNQGTYTGFELQQAHLVKVVGADGPCALRVKMHVHNCHFEESTADGYNIDKGTDILVEDCTSNNIFRVAVGGGGQRYVNLEVNRWHTSTDQYDIEENGDTGIADNMCTYAITDCTFKGIQTLFYQAGNVAVFTRVVAVGGCSISSRAPACSKGSKITFIDCAFHECPGFTAEQTRWWGAPSFVIDIAGQAPIGDLNECVLFRRCHLATVSIRWNAHRPDTIIPNSRIGFEDCVFNSSRDKSSLDIGSISTGGFNAPVQDSFVTAPSDRGPPPAPMHVRMTRCVAGGNYDYLYVARGSRLTIEDCSFLPGTARVRWFATDQYGLSSVDAAIIEGESEFTYGAGDGDGTYT